ncbi:MAG: tripartite tricarboxylate transporter substrate binding protein, partial [Cupriavidus sp.]|nr:tripartite tricarboxylate transporter substrate binding protein [Cupriavidus sp.]
PAKTPAEVVERIGTEVNKVLARPDVIRAIHEQGAEPRLMSAQQFAEVVRSEYKAWKPIVERSGAKLE